MKNPQGGGTPFGQLLGMRGVHKEKNLARYELEVVADHFNKRGVAHGGVVASLLDTAPGASVVFSLTPEEWTGTLELSVQFPARRCGPVWSWLKEDWRGAGKAWPSLKGRFATPLEKSWRAPTASGPSGRENRNDTPSLYCALTPVLNHRISDICSQAHRGGEIKPSMQEAVEGDMR
jgi:hypothetical protein